MQLFWSLVAAGHIYIAVPPLFWKPRATRPKSETDLSSLICTGPSGILDPVSIFTDSPQSLGLEPHEDRAAVNGFLLELFDYLLVESVLTSPSSLTDFK